MARYTEEQHARIMELVDQIDFLLGGHDGLTALIALATVSTMIAGSEPNLRGQVRRQLIQSMDDAAAHLIVKGFKRKLIPAEQEQSKGHA